MNTFDQEDTIAAVASPRGPGWRGLVRLSGPEAWPIALGGFELDDGPDEPLELPAPSRPEIVVGRLAVEGMRHLLPATLALWPGPRTYTGQPIAEIHTLGAQPLLALVLAQCLVRGARHAEPGEFTLRAFLAGRIDLTRAEAVLGVIDARSPAELAAALDQHAGGLAGPVVSLRDRLLDVLAHLEANLDFAHEADVEGLGREFLAVELDGGSALVQGLAARLQSRERAEELPRVVLIGPPNVGKSRLFNALLGREQAIVAPHSGTTRDYLSAMCTCGALKIELVDTAGIEPATSMIEGRAQAMRAGQASSADLLLDCRSAEASSTPAVLQAAEDEIPRLPVWTKCDLAPPPDLHRGELLVTSAQTGAGLEALRQAIAERLGGSAGGASAPASTAARCRESLQAAGNALADASATLATGGGDELVAVDLRLAVDELGKVVGAVVTDDILDRIFRRFCIGK